MRIFGVLTLLLLTTSAQAELVTSQAWNSPFTTAAGEIAPTSVDNPNGSPYLQASSNAIVTGSGFLYSFSGPLVVDVFVPNYDLGSEYLTDLTLNVGLSPDGMPLDPSSVVVTPFGGAALEADSFSESNSVWTFNWSLPSNVASYQFNFSGGPHMALGSVSVTTTTAAVPEPAAVVSFFIGLGGLGLVAVRRRGQRLAARQLA